MTEEKRRIRGVEVIFPCRPYPSQFSFMDKVIQGLEKGQNCLLESPTGSGKSLALLCSALAWQTAEKEKKRQEELAAESNGHKECTCKLKQTVVDEESLLDTELTSSPACPGSHISISIVKGQIAHQEVGVIVNTTSTNLQLNYGAVSQSLLCVGGPQLQRECNQRYPEGVLPGHVAVTSGGGLKCQELYHGALPHWREPDSVAILQTFLRNCLVTANTSGHTSIAIPALGTGSLGYPKEVVVREMYGEVEKFATCNPQSSLTDVRFVVYSGDLVTVKAFEDKQRERIRENHLSKTSADTSKEKSTTVIPESDDEDSDFKPLQKYRTPGQSSAEKTRKHQGITYETDEPGPSTVDQNGGTCTCNCGAEKPSSRKVPKIYFGTRTHKQIAQIVRELKKTAYREARMTILASKEYTCIHPEVSKMKNKNEGCKELMDGPGCKFNDRVKKIFPHYSNLQEYGLSEAWDLEDFVHLCKPKKVCPYFSVRGFRNEVDIVFCPYNYLIDPIIRQNMDINLKNEIIILDEAHNIEDSAREGASEHFTDEQMDKAFKEIHEMIVHDIMPADHLRLQQMVEGFMKLIQDNLDQLEQKDFEQAAKVWSGFDIVARMKNYGIGPEQQDALLKCFTSVCEDASERTVKNMRGQTVKLSSATLSTMERMFKTMDFMYRDNMKFTEDFRVALLKSKTYVADNNTDDMWMSSRNRRGGYRTVAKYTVTLHFWCMNPGVAFSDLHNTRCIVLTSGTLSPMNSFESELGTPFPIKLEANHVIEDKQVWVGAMSQGPTGKALHAVYKTMETLDFQDELGKTVLQVCQEVPHGVLCFLPSYRSLDKFTERWKQSGIYQQISRKKKIIMEPRRSDKDEFDDLMKNFYDTIHGINDEDDEDITEETDGALFLAVCRGKVSEGMDFADNFARAVITVGIPYPNWKDLQVAEKRMYNDRYKNSRGLLSGHEWYEIQAFRALNQALGRCIRHRGLLSGHEWYEIQAFRALNQALGRCIRHRKDWGALILADERFVKQKDKYCKGLSKWVRNKVQSFTSCKQAMESISTFAKQRIKDMPVINPDTSFIPGTPITPGQAISRRTSLYDSVGTPGAASTPMRPHVSPLNQSTPGDISPDTPSGISSLKDKISKFAQPNFFTPNAKMSASTSTWQSEAISHTLMSPTEVRKSASLTAAAQAGTVIQTQPGLKSPIVMANQQTAIGQGQPFAQQTTTNKVQGQIVLNPTVYQYILSVMNSPLMPKDKPYYIIVDEGTPNQQMFLIQPNPAASTNQVQQNPGTGSNQIQINAATTTNQIQTSMNQVNRPQQPGMSTAQQATSSVSLLKGNNSKVAGLASKGNQQASAKPNTLFRYYQTPVKSEGAKEVKGERSMVESNQCPQSPNLFDTQDSEQEFKTEKNTRKCNSAKKNQPDKEMKVESENKNSINRLEFEKVKNESMIADKDEANETETPNTRSQRKPIFRRHSVAPTITIDDDSEDACDFKDQSKSRRKSCDKVLTEIQLNVKEKVEDAKNRAVENQEDENESEEILKTRRKGRGAKRKSQSNVRMTSKKSKGVDFLDNVEDDKDIVVKREIKCNHCGLVLFSQIEDFERRKRYPDFVKKLAVHRFAEVILLTSIDFKSSRLQKVTTKLKEDSDLVLDSFVDTLTGSVLQYLCCSDCTQEVVGIQVVRKGDNCKDIEDNQAWIVSSLVNVSKT